MTSVLYRRSVSTIGALVCLVVHVNLFDNNICIVSFEPKVKAKKSISSM